MDSAQLLIKVTSIGDIQVGKSCLIKKYCEGRFVDKYITTIGVDYGVKKMTIQGQKCSINFFDLSGDDDYCEIRNPFLKDSQGMLMVFDLDNKDSFLNLNKWERLMKENGVDTRKCVVFVIGNKEDLKSSEVSESEVNNFCRQRGYEYMKASAKSGQNVNDIFEKLFFRIVSNIKDDIQRIKI